ncbi:MAG: OsmC family protein [Chloroflexota bacterium]|nr:OsmC family protein [Chloroflexota bacterium]
MVKTIIARWRSGSLFQGVSDGDGGRVELAGEEGVTGYRPTTLLLTALAACAGMDVMAICRKKRQNVEHYEVVASGEQRPDAPRTFSRIVVDHRFQGGSVEPGAVRRAIELSATQYCPVSAHLSQGKVTISHRYTISGAAGDDAAEVVVTGPDGAGLRPAQRAAGRS